MQLVSDSLSLTQRPLCVVLRLGRGEKEIARGAIGRHFSSSHHPPRALKFLIIAIFIEIPNGSLLGGESRRGHIPMKK